MPISLTSTKINSFLTFLVLSGFLLLGLLLPKPAHAQTGPNGETASCCPSPQAAACINNPANVPAWATPVFNSCGGQPVGIIVNQPTTPTSGGISGTGLLNAFRAFQYSGYVGANGLGNVVCSIDGGSPVPNNGCFSYDANGVPTVYNDRVPGGGALGSIGSTMVAMYSTPPTSTTTYLASIGKPFGVKPAYAQVAGSGSGVIQPVLNLWEITRNIAYLGFMLVFLVIGFMIMFRQRLNPQTVITIQTAIPGLVVAMILVFFSYFIASLIIDLSFLAVQLVAYLFSQSTTGNIITNANDLATNANIFELFRSFAGLTLNGGTGVVGSVAEPIRTSLENVFPGANGVPLVSGVLRGLINGASGVSGVLVSFILAIALLIQMIRLLWALLNSYISVLVLTIFGPFLILISALPGRHGALTFWWKSLLGNVLVFPAVFGTFLFAGIILGNTDAGAFTHTLPLFNGMPAGLLRVILGYGVILGVPAVPKMVKTAIGVRDLQEFAGAAIAGASAGYATGAAFARGGTGFAAERAGLPARYKAMQDMSVSQAAASRTGSPSRVRDAAAWVFGKK